MDWQRLARTYFEALERIGAGKTTARTQMRKIGSPDTQYVRYIKAMEDTDASHSNEPV